MLDGAVWTSLKTIEFLDIWLEIQFSNMLYFKIIFDV